ncbi:MAG: aspartate kinase [Deltaproteobacteria bacterium CG_4_10_14_0_2_um_filter_43_8]|nr:MAG: aspartate kinase [Deltaproteobacteria bacterium CG11_big_fil_rev_8_21_14_0_20_42_23]PJA20393.1 MAG: aspartate kinase [Deltaproteobacteria bacterium CG_4_10_14_0_2_um_filter_43_8]PJC63792.1 MAG: aspartate kinase [Deltaproteobacteria bacterium CG_4_9_14_0_2_um_filter_42_21]
MTFIVQKFGGTSVGDIKRIQAVADKIIEERKRGNAVLAVVSAMAGETNRLLKLASEMSEAPQPLHQDVLVSTGEQVTVALLCMALENKGYTAEPFLGHQAGIVTDEHHGKARIRRIDTDRIRHILKKEGIPVVAGFQGVTEAGAITTIGRGGSDTTAVALAAALNADRCDIYTDVKGVYTADPRICANARLLKTVSYEEMLELADAGAKVLHSRSVEIAAKHKVKLRVLSSFEDGAGTEIVTEDQLMEDILVSGVTLNIDEAKIAIRQVPDKPGITAQIFKPLSDAGINVDMIVQNVSKEGLTDLTFTVPKQDLKQSMLIAEAVAADTGAGKVEMASDIAKISVVGVGMRTHAGVAYKMFRTLADEGISVHMISTSEIKVSIVIDAKCAELVVRALHSAFELDQKK